MHVVPTCDDESLPIFTYRVHVAVTFERIVFFYFDVQSLYHHLVKIYQIALVSASATLLCHSSK